MSAKSLDILRCVFILITLSFILLITYSGISLEKLEWVLLGFVITVGMSHGSLDWLLARHWGIRRNGMESLLFIAAYGLSVLLTSAVWWWVPGIGLGIFLLMSLLHFASDWQDELSRSASLIMGITVIALPGVMFQKEVFALFSLLVATDEASMLSQGLHVIGSVAIASASLIAYQQIKVSTLLAVEILGLVLIGLVLSPVIYFSIYFCVLHSTKHWLKMKSINVYQDFWQALLSVVWPTALCIVVGIWVCTASATWSFSEAFIRTVFIGLAALTVPHWLLLEIYPLFCAHKIRKSAVRLG